MNLYLQFAVITVELIKVIVNYRHYFILLKSNRFIQDWFDPAFINSIVVFSHHDIAYIIQCTCIYG